MKYIDLRERTKEDILQIVMEKNIEIERLTKQNKALNEVYELTKKEYKRLNNIIKEVREYIEIIVKNTPSSVRKDYANMLLIDYKKVLDILDKGE